MGSKKQRDLNELYDEYCHGLQDSTEHIVYMLNSYRCFVEWVEETYPERMDELL